MDIAARPMRRERLSFSRIPDVLGVPNLIEIQQKSYQWFLEEGLLETFRDISPVQDFFLSSHSTIFLPFIEPERSADLRRLLPSVVLWHLMPIRVFVSARQAH
jgi:DNA-directed RNA polymerase beta subunit